MRRCRQGLTLFVKAGCDSPQSQQLLLHSQCSALPCACVAHSESLFTHIVPVCNSQLCLALSCASCDGRNGWPGVSFSTALALVRETGAYTPAQVSLTCQRSV